MSGSIPNSGAISFINLKNVFGGEIPIKLSDYYQNSTKAFTKDVISIPVISNPLSISIFRGKSKIVSILKSITLTTQTFNLYGTPGGWPSANSSTITIPSDYRTLVSWDLTFYAYKNSTSYGWAYPNIGINNVGGIGVNGTSASAQSIVRTWNNQTLTLGSANTPLTCYVNFYTQGGLTNCYFTLTIRYYT
jgi:hypothetical protein